VWSGKVRKLITASVALLLFTPPIVEAKDLYVNAATGNDATSYAQNGPSNPWRTIGRAAWGSASRTHVASEAARAGDVVHVAAGTYDQAASGSERLEPLFNPANNGTSGNPIVFIAEGRVTLRSTTWGGPVIGCASRNYITWDGFYIDEAFVNTVPDTGPVVAFSSQGCTLRRLEIKSKYAAWADNHNGIRLEQANGTVIQNNLIYEVGSEGARGQNDACVMSYDSNDSVIENNTFHSSGVGVFIKGQHPGFTQDRTIIRRNLIFNMGASGIMLLASRDARVYQNVIRDSQWGLTVYSLGGGPTNDIWANNTVHNSRYAGIRFRGSATGWSNIRFFNNVVTGSSEAAVNGEMFSGPSSSSFQHNAYFGFQNFANFAATYRTFDYWRNTWGQDQQAPASTSSDPRYVDAAGGDFRLCTGPGAPAATCTTGSSVLNLGIDILDLNNNGSATDAIRPGAYITGNEVIGHGGTVTTSPAPSAPTNVRVIR
jgi:hypothetical protein